MHNMQGLLALRGMDEPEQTLKGARSIRAGHRGHTHISAKKRAAIAAAISSTVGSTAGLTAAHLGLDPNQSAQIGAVVSGAVGNLLSQAFRLTPNDGDRASEGSSPFRAAEIEPTVSDEVASPGRASESDRKHPRHRKLERAARRRIERRHRAGRKEKGHDTS
ncbi:hypothetical protein ACFFS2_18360 [Streptomyces aurantiacus]|uniref:hypothetical protein n=1 Tax=Streptomyces aurantiacus TaxID=47760 RepID=UPI0012FED4DF|nr:hypothetical protein [Streptomyces aurantiacus]